MDHEKQNPIDSYQINEAALENGRNPIPHDLRHQVGQQIIGEINQLKASGFGLEQFAEKVVNLIRDGFGLYFVGLYIQYLRQNQLNETGLFE